MVPPPEELSTWKEIAAYLGISVKAAQLWERQRGLPVRRLPGEHRGQVRALVGELEAWKAQATESSSGVNLPAPLAVSTPVGSTSRRWFSTRLAIAAVVLLALLAGSIMLALHRPVLASVRVEQEAIVGLDDRGGVLWRHPVGTLEYSRYLSGAQRVWHGRLGGQDVVLVVPVPAGVFTESVPLLCLDARGRELWRYAPTRTLRVGAEVFPPLFLVAAFAVINDQVLVSSHHHLHSASQVAVLSKGGQLLREYWHQGHLNTLTVGSWQGRPVVFAGGINNVRSQATIVVLDPARLGGAAIEEGQPVFDGMTPGVEEARLLFPRSCITDQGLYNKVFQILQTSAGLVVDVHEHLDDPHEPNVLYHLDGDLSVRSLEFSDGFRNWHANAKHSLRTEEAALRSVVRLH